MDLNRPEPNKFWELQQRENKLLQNICVILGRANDEDEDEEESDYGAETVYEYSDRIYFEPITSDSEGLK